MSHTTFTALGTYVFLATRSPSDLPRARMLAGAILAEVDLTCSRFRADSDLSRANSCAGEWTEVDPLLVAAVTVAVTAARQTDGLVTPLLGRRLVELGYDRDHGLLTELADLELTLPSDPPDPNSWQRLRLGDATIRVPRGTALDLGATGKAWAADLIAAAFAAELSGSALVSLGGDIAVAAPDGDPWPVAISTRPGDQAETTIAIHGGGLATSSTQVRRWARRGVRLHHLLDPRTGLPAPTTWRSVTATGSTCTAANTATTAAIVLGDEGPAWLTERCVTARLVTEHGRVRTTGDWPRDDRPAGPQHRRSA